VGIQPHAVNFCGMMQASCPNKRGTRLFCVNLNKVPARNWGIALCLKKVEGLRDRGRSELNAQR
jgi:hypothetical protein